VYLAVFQDSPAQQRALSFSEGDIGEEEGGLGCQESKE